MPRLGHAPRLRPERLIAAGRVVLAISSLFAVWLDTTEPRQYAAEAQGLLGAYAVYAGLVAVLVWRREAVSRLWPLLTHIGDLVFFSLFIYFTEGPGSPFTVYFVFALIGATLRWQSRGTLWTAIAALSVFFAFGFYFGVTLRHPAFELRAFIIRGVYLIVLAVLLGYVGAHEQRTLREMSQLASWPQTHGRNLESLASDLLNYAAPLLDAPRAMLAWTEPDAPWRRLAVWDDGRFTHERHPVSRSFVAEELAERSFICANIPTRRTLVQEPNALHLEIWRGEPIEPEFASRLDAKTVVSARLHGESFDGRLFFLDKPDATLDDLVIAEIMGRVIAARLDAFYLTEELRHAAATEERIRFARDLHDGVLQSFTGIGLKLQAVRRMMGLDRTAAVAALEDVQRVLASEQRDIRFFIQELKPATHPAQDAALSLRLGELAQRMEREWDLRVDLQVDAPDTLPPALSRDVYHIVREGLVNAARHGGASLAQVSLATAGPETIAVSIVDNGRGFSFSGRYSADDLARLDLGPKTLRERVVAMHGSLTLQSGPSGAALHVTLPAVAA